MGRVVALVGCFLVAAAVGCNVLSFASPYWVESFDEFTGNRFVKAGLWEFCFNDYTFYKDHNGKRYLGCFYIFSDTIRPLWEWLSPPWFIVMQVMVSLSLLIHVINAIFLTLYVFKLFPKYFNSAVLLGSAAVMLFSLGIIFVVLIVFGVKKEDRQWIPRPDMNFLSWSYGLYCMSGWASLFAALALYKGSREADDGTTPYNYPKVNA
ncbi:uncharacterized protein [Littorina saxatilis]|uniref:Uncharacterized protein n=1 Tax=Littorina saxatilis TaxID=31220 RepID=A0AAN9G1V0_9CAEN